MKILKKGTIHSKKVYRTQCGWCKTEFEFLQSEADQDTVDLWKPMLKCDCPNCKKHVYVIA